MFITFHFLHNKYIQIYFKSQIIKKVDKLNSLFLSSTSLPLDKVVYIDEEENSADGINGAIQKANDIFQAGRTNRKTAHQVILYTHANSISL